MTEQPFHYWAYLCFCPLDNRESAPDADSAPRLRWAELVTETLQTFPVPAEFIGQPNSRGETIPARIEPIYPAAATDQLTAAEVAALNHSRCLIVICSPHAARSRAVNEAVLRFQQLGRGNRILPFVIAGEPNASAGTKPGLAPEAECFVPALLHPLAADGQLNPPPREASYFFADARFGADRQELTTATLLRGETELAIAKIHLLSGVLGVGFYGLWQREQKRRFIGFAAAQQQVREVQSQFAFVREQAAAAQAQLAAMQAQARETLSQLEAARQEARAAQTQLLTQHDVPLDLQTQIRAAQDQAHHAQQQTQAMHNQLEALQAQARASQEQLDAARQQVLATEQKAEAAEQQARIAQAQLEQARAQAREFQQQADAAREQLLAAATTPQPVLTPPPDPQPQIQELENQLRAAQAQVQIAQQQAQTFQAQAQTTQAQLEQARRDLHSTQAQLAAAQQQAQAAQTQLQKIQQEAQALQAQITAAQAQADTAQTETRRTQSELAATRQRISTARRLTQVFAVLTVLAALAAGVVWSQRQAARAQLAQCAATHVPQLNTLTNQLSAGQIRLALEQLRDWDTLAQRIPRAQWGDTLALAGAILTEPNRRRFQEQLFSLWRQADARAAFDWSCQSSAGDNREFYLQALIPTLATNAPDAQAAFDWLQQSAHPDAISAGARQRLLVSLFQTWASTDWPAATNASAQLPEGETKMWVARLLLRHQIQADPAAVASTITNQPPGVQRRELIAELSARWGQTDATNALVWLETLPSESDRSIAFDRIVSNWANTDLSATTNWLATLPAEQQNAALLTIAVPWAQHDARGLADHAFTLPPGEVQTRCLREAVRAFAPNDLARTMELLQPLTNNAPLREQLLEQAARELAATNLSHAADFLASLPPDADQQAAIRGLIANWSHLAPEAALHWLSTFPATNPQPAHLEFTVNTWAQTEPAAAAQWLAAQPADSITEALCLAFLDGAVMQYPEFAARWTDSVPDEPRRRRLQMHLAQQWQKHHPATAPQWLETLTPPATPGASPD